MTQALVVGAGPAGLMAAETLAEAGLAVTVLERMPSLGRKLLMAGRGGLNITHAEPLERFLARYGDAPDIVAAVRAFPPDAIRAWCAGLGIETFVGSSGRVFPVGMKASPLLRAWLRRLDTMGVRLITRAAFRGWDADNAPIIEGASITPPDVTILATGGASWPRLGSDGAWVRWFDPADVALLRPANMGFHVDWSAHFRDRFAGAPIKRAAFTFAGQSVRGEAVVTAAGIEGGAIYALSRSLRDAGPGAVLTIDLRPDLDAATLAGRLGGSGTSLANRLRRAGLDPVAAALVREAALPGPPPANLASWIKALPIRLGAPMGLERAISSAGGLRTISRPGVFAAGEMLDWEAPTGGYLLTACLATGRAAALAAVRSVS